MKNDGIMIGREYIKALRRLSSEDLGILMMAVLDTEEGVDPDIDEAEHPIVLSLYEILMASITRVKGISEQNSVNGQQGGRPPKKTEKAPVSEETSEEKPPVFEEKSAGFENEKAHTIPYHTIPYHTIPGQTIPNEPNHDGQSARPTADEVKDWAEAEGLLIDAERFVAYYDDRDWKTGTDPIKDWKKVARKWAQTEHRKPPEKPPDRKPGKYTRWMESQDYGDLISGRAKA